MRILIAGGGIGGLTLALMLHRRGIDCAVMEAAANVRSAEIGFNLPPQAVAELESLGLLAELDRIGVRTRSVTYANHRGQTIWSEPRGQFGGHAMPQFTLQKAKLHALLWRIAVERLGAGNIQPSHTLVGFTQDAGGVRARFNVAKQSYVEFHGDALVGAGGVTSWLRSALHPAQAGLHWNGVTMWHGATDLAAFDGGDSVIMAGDALIKVILYPVAQGEAPGTRLTSWTMCGRQSPQGGLMPHGGGKPRRCRYGRFRALAERLQLPFVEIERLTKATPEIFESPVCDGDPLPWWTSGRVTLMGDAAHPTYAVHGSGLLQAILDARCLSDLLAETTAAKALAAYEAERLPATAKVVRATRAGGPERVIDVIAARSPQGFDRLDDVLSREEIAALAQGQAPPAGLADAPG